MTPPRHRCPWFMSGLAFGLLLGVWCIHTGIEGARTPSTPTAFSR